MKSIQVEFNACLTIIFVNESLGDETPSCIVCADYPAYIRKLEEMKAQKHIKILQNGPSTFIER